VIDYNVIQWRSQDFSMGAFGEGMGAQPPEARGMGAEPPVLDDFCNFQ